VNWGQQTQAHFEAVCVILQYAMDLGMASLYLTSFISAAAAAAAAAAGQEQTPKAAIDRKNAVNDDQLKNDWVIIEVVVDGRRWS
jgi:hypothetical protein